MRDVDLELFRRKSLDIWERLNVLENPLEVYVRVRFIHWTRSKSSFLAGILTNTK